jgi:hypothetical protein
MLNPIKRTWVPKIAPTKAPEIAPAPITPPQKLQTAKATAGLGARFDELPSPDMEEKNSDSIWAAFESVHVPEIERD